jgi:pimeloyl-ACP methyl ester carboxylesterase
VPTAHGNGIDIEYVTSGDPADPALLLVMGLGAQLIAWPEAFVQQLTARGFFTIRYDNRDSGLSTKFTGTPDFVALFGGDVRAVPYLIEDMADDAVALLDELGVARAHLMTRRAETAYDRSYCPEGTGRQLAAILGSPDRTEGLHKVALPFLVIHGEDDPLVAVSGGKATAAAVPGSELIVIPGMGHDLPDAAWDQIIDAIVANTALATV